jgi:glutamate racemase
MNRNPVPSPSSPIGVFDSGVGGLSVLTTLRQALPQEDFLYLADSAHAPYGEKSSEYIRARCFSLCDFLLQHGVKAIVIACNTATAVALPALRAHFPVPIIALEPAVKPAVATSRCHEVGVLATARTLESQHFLDLAARFANQAHIIPQPCPRLVTLLEAGEEHSSAMQAAVQDYVEPLLAAGADALVLGCTHFVFLRDQIAAVAGDGVTLHDSGAGVARVLQRRLETQQTLRPRDESGFLRFFSSAATDRMQGLMTRLWGGALTLEPLKA